MKKTILSFFCILTLAASHISAKDWSTVRLAVDVPYEPFEFKLPDGTLTGFEVDLGNAICKEIKANCEWVIQAWDGIIPGLLARKYDAIMSSMSITPERAKKVLFSEGYYNTPSAWFGPVAVAGLDVTSEDALKGKTIGVQRGTVQDNHASDTFGSVADIKRYSTADDLVVDLQGGRLDLVLLDFPVGEKTIMSDPAYAQIGDLLQLGEGVGVAFRKRDKDLAGKFNAALKKLKTDGTYDSIRKKYFSYEIKI
jgi:arginine/ornithine transport system substrate-binding protein